MKKPTNIKIIKRKGEGYFRLSYRQGNTSVTTQGFKTLSELLDILKDDTIIELKI